MIIQNDKDMTNTATVSHTGKVRVKANEMISGRGIEYKGKAENGQHIFLMTENAYTKISLKCVWVN